MRIKSQKDFWSGLMFIIVGGSFAIGALNYSFGSSARPGPAYFPFGLGVLLAILGGMILFEALTIETEDGEPIGAFAWKPLFIILGAVILFGFMLPRIGMVISLPILVLISAYASDEHTWVGTIVNATILTVMSWLVFVVGLKLTIPLWPAFMG
ncbi:tripartite tricarboxylate transporter TctB family protein [Ideonella sp. YS5]|uniref:tripartite tricarboxylate transporter TctB family protein n=1 Tax=Ideonella sp. YS5 TaxID=3453714 RepID=UPI003EEE20CB